MMAVERGVVSNEQKGTDEVILKIAEYAVNGVIESSEAYETARACLADTLGCGILALNYPECVKLLGPVVAGTTVPGGARVPGRTDVLDPIRAAFNIGTMIRWLDFNDTWLAAEWGHPSDNLGALLALCDYLSQKGEPLTVRDLLTAMIKAHEIQGVLALSNSFNRVGFDHVILVKIASAAVSCALLGGTVEQVADVVSLAFVDAGPLRTYRHAPNTGSRKSWAAGDQTARGLQLAWMVMQGEMGYKTPLTAERWGVQDVMMNGKQITLERPLGSYVMEQVLFKISFPAEFHAQTAVEAAVTLHKQIGDRQITKVTLTTHESALRIIDKTGPLHNPADRDHCLQYMVAIALLHGDLTADHYEDSVAQDPKIDALRAKMVTEEEPRYTKEYLDADKRSIANRVTVELSDGTTLTEEVEYPIGHRRRREEGIPVLYAKFKRNLATQLDASKVEQLTELFGQPEKLEALSVGDFAALW